jgi:hypothetical protein
MKGFYEMNNLTKLYRDALSNINLDLFKSYNFDAIRGINYDVFKNLNSITSSIDAFNSINNIASSFAFDAFKSINFNAINDLNSIISRVDLNAFKNSSLDAAKTLNTIMPNINFGAFDKINSIIPSFYFDIHKNINFDITQTLNDLSEIEEFDDSYYEKIDNIGKYALNTTSAKYLPSYFRKATLINIYQKLRKVIRTQEFGYLLMILIFCFQTFYKQKKNQKLILRETIREIIIIERVYKELNLRGITNNGAKLYRKPNTKSTSILALECGDIVEVLKINKKWVYIKLYNTDIEGWVLKKYTKGTKN